MKLINSQMNSCNKGSKIFNFGGKIILRTVFYHISLDRERSFLYDETEFRSPTVIYFEIQDFLK